MIWDSKERRKFVRVKLPCEVIVPNSNRYTISTYTKNINAGGIMLTAKKQSRAVFFVSSTLNNNEKLHLRYHAFPLLLQAYPDQKQVWYEHPPFA